MRRCCCPVGGPRTTQLGRHGCSHRVAHAQWHARVQVHGRTHACMHACTQAGGQTPGRAKQCLDQLQCCHGPRTPRWPCLRPLTTQPIDVLPHPGLMSRWGGVGIVQGPGAEARGCRALLRAPWVCGASRADGCGRRGGSHMFFFTPYMSQQSWKTANPELGVAIIVLIAPQGHTSSGEDYSRAISHDDLPATTAFALCICGQSPAGTPRRARTTAA